MKQILLPYKIISSFNIKNSDALLKKKSIQPILQNNQEWLKKLACFQKNSYIIIDFGKEMNGGIRIVTCDALVKTFQIRIRFGESLAETISDAYKDSSTNDHSPRDFVATISSLSSLKFGETGFRFVRIDFVTDTNVYIQNIFCENYILNLPSKYSYGGNDIMIKNIFDVAKRTIDLCASSNYIVDGIKRDRLVWVGDMHPEMLALVSLYGKMNKIENSLNFVKKSTLKNQWMNNIASYSMWWIINVCDYYNLTKSKEFFLNQVKTILSIINQINDKVDEHGNMFFEWLFTDWQTVGTVDEEAGMRAICIFSLNKAKELFQVFSIDVSLIDKILYKLNKKDIVVKQQKQVVALKFFAGKKLSDSDYKLLIKNGAEGLSTFMSYYVLTAIASVNKEKAIDIMKEYYGEMLKMGATTFWEDFNILWAKDAEPIDVLPKDNKKNIHRDFGAHCYVGLRHSLCHGWSAGVIRFIYENC